MISRRNMAKTIPAFLAIGALAACAGPGGTVVTLAQVQSWVAIVNSQLPAFIAESEATNILKGTADVAAKQALAKFQEIAAQFLSPTFNVANTATIVSEIAAALTSILSAIPATVPYVGFIQLAVLVITGFLAAKPITVPPLPTSESLHAMHVQNVHYRK